MKPLRVAVVTRLGSTPGRRNCGWWAYDVPEFKARGFEVAKHAELSRTKFYGHDVVIWEDGKLSCNWIDAGPPLCLTISDSTLSPEHYARRLQLARRADLLLVDWDRLERFTGLGKPVRRLSYCVNDRRFKPDGERTVDVCYHVSEDMPERRDLGDWLDKFCAARGYTFARGVRLGDEYARAFARARVCVNQNRNAETRNHRLFDAMGSGCAVLTDPVPDVSGEARTAGVHYRTWESRDDLAGQLDLLVATGEWQEVAAAGLALVQERHTWSVRARELYATLLEALPALRQGRDG